MYLQIRGKGIDFMAWQVELAQRLSFVANKLFIKFLLKLIF